MFPNNFVVVCFGPILCLYHFLLFPFSRGNALAKWNVLNPQGNSEGDVFIFLHVHKDLFSSALLIEKNIYIYIYILCSFFGNRYILIGIFWWNWCMQRLHT